jgi:RecA/RadA recombinase
VITPQNSDISEKDAMQVKQEESDSEEHDYDDSDLLRESDGPEEEFIIDFEAPSDLIKERQLSQRFYTDTAFDELLDGKGIREGDIIEICGRHQIGKTTIVTTLALNILAKYPEAQIAFIDTKNDIQSANLHRTLLLRGYDEESIVRNFFDRIILFQASNIFEFKTTLKTIVKGEEDYKKVSFIIIDSITVPFYHATPNLRQNMKLTSQIHQLIFALAKKMNKVVSGCLFFILKLILLIFFEYKRSWSPISS